MPAYLPVTATTVNYAPVVFVGFVSISAAWYFVWGRKHYRGPPTETIGLLPGQRVVEEGDGALPKKD